MITPAPTATTDSWLELPDGRTFWLMGRCTIGRSPDNDLVLEVPELSRQHAMIARDGGNFLLSDLHSRNGTYLNGTAVTRPAHLRDGDEIRFGTTTLRFRRKRSGFGPAEAAAVGATTQAIDQIHESVCWLLLVDVVGSATLTEKLGSEAALRQLQGWITALRPLIEKNGGQINGYVGDAVLALWVENKVKPQQVITALQAIEAWRPRSKLPFRLVSHYGSVLFSRSENGQEITGTAVNVVFRSEKIARGFGAQAMISEAGMTTLGLTGQCESYGRSSIDGMREYYIFHALPAAWTPAPPVA